MRAARLRGYRTDLVVEDVPAPEIRGPADVIVRIAGAGLCRTDLHVIDGFFAGRVDGGPPLTPGHENAGWVEDAGPAVRSVRPGQAVIVHPVLACGRCPACRAGEDARCADQLFPGIDADGGFAERLLTRERALVPLPEGVAPALVAPHADAGLTAYRVARRAAARLAPGGVCAVVGVGGVGHIAVQLLRRLGAAEVVAIDRSRAALDLAAALGADHLVDAAAAPAERVRELTGGRGADAVIDTVGEDDAIVQALAMLAPGGTYWAVGYGGTVAVPAIDLVAREIQVAGSLVGSRSELAELMDLVARGLVELRTAEYRLEDVNDAIAALRAGGLAGRAVIVP